MATILITCVTFDKNATVSRRKKELGQRVLFGKIGVTWETQWSATTNWQALSLNVVSNSPSHRWKLTSQNGDGKWLYM